MKRNKYIITVLAFFLTISACINNKEKVEENIEDVANYNMSVWEREFFINTRHIKAEWLQTKDSIRNGFFRSYTFDGLLNYEENYSNGQLNGISRSFYDSAGSNFIENEGVFKSGKRIGAWKFFYPNGFIKGYDIYDSLGVLRKKMHFDIDGNILHTSVY